MITIGDKIHVNMEQTLEILRRHTAKGGVILDLDRILDYRSFFIMDYNDKCRDIDNAIGTSGFRVKKSTFEDVMHMVFPNDVDFCRVHEGGTSKLTSDSKLLKRALDKGVFSKGADNFIRMYLDASKIKTAYGNLGLYTTFPLLDVETFDGHRAVLAKPEWFAENTGRIGSRNPNIQGISKKQCDIITYIKGYHLFRYDSGQIEPRITYSYYIKDKLISDLIRLYNDAYFGLLMFILMPKEEEDDIRRGDRQLVKKEITQEYADLRKDLKVLLLAGNYGGGLKGFDPKLADGFIRKVQNHPMRKALEAKAIEQIRQGDNVFYSAFGTPIIPKSTSKYAEGSSGWKDHVRRCAINNPIQATAADCLRESIYQQDKLLREESSGMSWIGYEKHDEGATYLADKDIKLKDQICGMTSYQIRDWIPIYADVVEGVKKCDAFDYAIKYKEIG